MSSRYTGTAFRDPRGLVLCLESSLVVRRTWTLSACPEGNLVFLRTKKILTSIRVATNPVRFAKFLLLKALKGGFVLTILFPLRPLKQMILSIFFNQLLGTLNLWTSVPAFLLYYLLYSSSERENPEGMIRDRKVNTLLLYSFKKLYVLITLNYDKKFWL